MIINRSIDIEYTIAQALKEYFNAYVRPLPKEYLLPHVEVTQVGGSDTDTIDTFEVVIDARAEDEATANETLRNAIGALRTIASDGTTAIRYVEVSSSGSWGKDPVRTDLAMCSARLRVTAHLETITLI